SVYRRQKKYDEALIVYRKSLSIKEKQNDQRGIAACYLNIGALFKYTLNFDSALLYVNKSLVIDNKIGSLHDKASDYLTRGDLYVSMNRPGEAKADLDTCIAISKKTGEPELVYNAYVGLVSADTLLKDHKKAFTDQLL